ncbi:MAG: tetratricopeptide repeat protein [Candidatus Zixiibacteriota bacterium]
MSRAEWLAAVALFATMALFGIASYVPLQSMWGINHLQFLPPWVWYAYWFACVLILLLIVIRGSESFFIRAVDTIGGFFFSDSIWPKLILVGVAAAAFYLFAMRTNFLGDGYVLLSVFGQGETHLEKWTETGAITVVHWLQSLFGEHTKMTALRTFRLLSFVSGAVVVYNLIDIAKRLSGRNGWRMVYLSILIFSSGLLLFFGYVELYPLLWATVTTFISLSLRYLERGRGLIFVLLLFALSSYLHLMTLCLAAGPALLIADRVPQCRSFLAKNWRFQLFVVGTVTLGVLAIGLIANELWPVGIFLPLITGRSGAEDYAVLSGKHLLDIANQLLLMYPGLIALTLYAFSRRTGNDPDRKRQFFGTMAAGAVVFLILVDPGLGMARDWDLMSLCVLPICLYLMTRIENNAYLAGGKLLAASIVLSAFVSITYVSANIVVESSEKRFVSLVDYYGSKDRSGWSSAAAYFRDKGDSRNLNLVLDRMNRYFPEEALLAETYTSLDRQDYARAVSLAQRLVALDSANTRYLQVLGKAYGKVGEYERGESCYLKALKIKPGSIFLRNELGQLYIQAGRYNDALRLLKAATRLDPTLSYVQEGIALAYFRMGFLDSASAVADTLFGQEANSAGGHLIRMIVAIQQGDLQTAGEYLAAFRQYGVGRSDYQSILEYYSYLER